MRHRIKNATLRTTATSFALLAANAMGGITLARSLGPTGRGELASLVVWSALASTLATLGTAGALTYFAALSGSSRRYAAEKVKRFYPVMAVTGLALFGIFATMGQARPSAALAAAAIAVPTRTLLAQTQAYLRGREHFTLFNWNRFIAGAGGSVIVVVLALGGVLTVTTAAFAYLGAYVLPLASGVRFARQDMLQPVSGAIEDANSDRRRFWSYSARSFAASIGAQGNQQIDLFAVSLVAPLYAVGTYAVASAFSRPISAVGAAAAMVLLPRVARAATPGDKLAIIRRSTTFVAIGGGLLVAGVFLFGDALIPLLFGSEFSRSVPVARILAIGSWALGLSLVAGAGLSGIGRPGVAATSQLVGMVVTLGVIAGVSGGNVEIVAWGAVAGFVVSLIIEGLALAIRFRSGSRTAQ